METQLSLSCRLKNRKSLTQPLTEDVALSLIAYGVFGSYTDDTGTFEGIDLFAFDKKGKLGPTTYTVEEANYVNPVSFEVLEEVLSINGREYPNLKKVIYNPDHLERKVYNAVTDRTAFHVSKNGTGSIIFEVEGDETDPEEMTDLTFEFKVTNASGNVNAAAVKVEYLDNLGTSILTGSTNSSGEFEDEISVLLGGSIGFRFTATKGAQTKVVDTYIDTSSSPHAVALLIV